MIPKQELLELAKEYNISPQVVEKDYVLGWLLAGIYQHSALRENWIFKGGTCLKKCYFETYRFSEDLDFTIRDATHLNEGFLQTTFYSIAEVIYEQTGIEFPSDRMIFEIFENPAGKIICQGRIFYKGPIAPTSPKSWPRIKIDLNADEPIVETPVKNPVCHNYSDAPSDGIHALCYSYIEVFAEKIRALGERTRPRDLYDVINFFRRPESIALGSEVKRVLSKKCEYKGIVIPNIIELDLHREECAKGWRDQLDHQLPSLPPFDSFWIELPDFFKWLEQSEIISTPILEHIKTQGEQVIQWDNLHENVTSATINILDKIRFAAANRLVVELAYRKDNNEEKTYYIEPYSLRKDQIGNILLYAITLSMSHSSQSVSDFNVHQILDARVTDQSFVPSYNIDFIPEGSSSFIFSKQLQK